MHLGYVPIDGAVPYPVAPVDHVARRDPEGEPVPGIGGGLPTGNHQQVLPRPVLVATRVPGSVAARKSNPIAHASATIRAGVSAQPE